MEEECGAAVGRVAVIGAGAAGLACGWLLARGGYDVTIFEASSQAGGHARTVEVPIRGNNVGATIPVDVGFMVYNTRTYPDLVSMFELLGVEEENSSMSFACSAESDKGLFEWGSEGLSSLFADRKNIVDPSMYAMLWDMRRFNKSVHQYVEYTEQHPDSHCAKMTLGEFGPLPSTILSPSPPFLSFIFSSITVSLKFSLAPSGGHPQVAPSPTSRR